MHVLTVDSGTYCDKKLNGRHQSGATKCEHKGVIAIEQHTYIHMYRYIGALVR